MGDDSTKLTTDIEYLKEAVDKIDSKLEQMNIGARLAVLEDRQKTIFTLVHWGFGIVGTLVSGIVLWLVTHQ